MCGVMEVSIVVGDPSGGMALETSKEFSMELGMDIGGEVGVKEETAVKEGVLEVEDRRMGHRGEGGGEGWRERFQGVERKAVSKSIWPGIGMTDSVGGEGGAIQTGEASGGELVGVDMDEGKVVGTEDGDRVKPGSGGVMRGKWGRTRGTIGNGVKGGDVVDSGAELSGNSSESGVMGGEEGRKDGWGWGRVGGEGHVQVEEMGEKAGVVVGDGGVPGTNGSPGGMEGREEVEKNKVEHKATIKNEDGWEGAGGIAKGKGEGKGLGRVDGGWGGADGRR